MHHQLMLEGGNVGMDHHLDVRRQWRAGGEARPEGDEGGRPRRTGEPE